MSSAEYERGHYERLFGTKASYKPVCGTHGQKIVTGSPQLQTIKKIISWVLNTFEMTL